jgi:hypothetical protein
MIRIDNLKTAILRGAGPWGEVHPSYAAYARAVGFHVGAARQRCPDECKVEDGSAIAGAGPPSRL